MDPDTCPKCNHAWHSHPGAILEVSICAECIYEEDLGERRYEDMCADDAPGVSDTPVRPGRLTVRVERSWVRRRYLVSINNAQGGQWACVSPPGNSAESAEATAASVTGDLAALPLRALRDKYLGHRR